ncbi:MAG TPA: OmpA family protein [Bacteroidia bacterium]|jgi:chemotaxis protein MotB|nr:OmpA family protein [Bacteroidia bacterium]
MIKKYFTLLVSMALLFSCVSKKKFRNEQHRVAVLQNDSTSVHTRLNTCNARVAELEKEKNNISLHLKNLSDSSQNALVNSNMTIADQEKRLRNLQALIQSQKDVLAKLKKTVADALVNFKPDELSVSVKDGKLYVSLQEKLLFKSGSAVVDPKGKDALRTLAEVLNNTGDISVLIEGHTDNVPITGKFEDNWSLSTARAISIVRILSNDYKVDPHRLIASGRSEFFPVDDNNTTEGKAKNRRTEIILSPNLKELFKLLNP